MCHRVPTFKVLVGYCSLNAKRRVRYLASCRASGLETRRWRTSRSFYRMYNSNFAVWIMCNDALGPWDGGGKGNGGRIWPAPQVEEDSLVPLCDCNVINNRGGGGPFPWWPLQATTPRSRLAAEIFSSSNGLELVAVRRPTCRSRIRVERLPPRSRVSWLLSIFLPQVPHDSCHCCGKFIDDGNAIARLSNICRITVDCRRSRNILGKISRFENFCDSNYR